ncbi:MAG TPA: caspase family protein [Flavobacterium sp.]|uniref:caspase family protein n=1 Tax=Flavobacterium sp. TaxID=239 RepID=UPI002DBCC10C|nr:caspase family protein [Flavobacterium sp.]HEU4791756.1 caspase family protein [Flavobacterium sp.]
MRKALIVGVNHYPHGSDLYGCVNDAYNVKNIIERNSDGSVNFDCKLITASSSRESIERGKLKDDVENLFSTKAEIALFYFAGHGHIEATGGYLLASDAKRGDDGLSLNDVLVLANKSPATNKIIILDSCHSGIAGNPPTIADSALLAEGITILTASTSDQYASEKDGSGVFTSLFVDALSGSGSNIIGDITPGSVYAHIDQSLGAWEQRPIFKTNVRNFVSLRKVAPSIPLDDLRKISDFFPTPGFEFQLDPTFEPEAKGRDEGMPEPLEENTRTFSILQKYNRLNLLVPIDAPHMWNAAMESKKCKLTALGEHYRRLAEKNRI